MFCQHALNTLVNGHMTQEIYLMLCKMQWAFINHIFTHHQDAKASDTLIYKYIVVCQEGGVKSSEKRSQYIFQFFLSPFWAWFILAPLGERYSSN